MAIRKDVEYPGRWEVATSEYPMGKPKNRTTSTSKDGSYLEKKWIQDLEAFLGAILNDVGESPNGSVDTAESSQFFDALNSKIQGEFLISANGYVALDSGIILQWSSNGSGNSGDTFSFPIPFPNGTLFVSSFPSSGGVASAGTSYAVRIESNAQYSIFSSPTSFSLTRTFAIGW